MASGGNLAEMGRNVLRPYKCRTASRAGRFSFSRFRAVDIFVFDVALGVGVYAGLVDAGELAFYFAGVAYYQAACWDFGAFEEQGACGYYAAGADVHTIQDYCAHADQAAVLDGAAVERYRVAYRDVVAEDERVLVAHDVEDAAVLDVGAGADADVVNVTANHAAGPDAGVFADDYVADDDGGGVNVGGGGDLGVLAAVGADVGLAGGFYGTSRNGIGGWVLVRHCTLAPLVFFVSVASKGFSFPVSLLDATLMRRLVSAGSKELKFT